MAVVGLVVVGVVLVGVAVGRQAFREKVLADRTDAGASPSDGNSSSADVAAVGEKPTEPAPAGTCESSQQGALSSASESLTLGKALYAKGLYDEARKAFVRAGRLAPQLNEPKRWIANCDREISIRGTVYVAPNVGAGGRKAPNGAHQRPVYVDGMPVEHMPGESAAEYEQRVQDVTTLRALVHTLE